MSLDCGGLTAWAVSSLRGPRHVFGEHEAGLAKRATKQTGRRERLAFDSEPVLVGLSLAIALRSRHRVRSQQCLQRNVRKGVVLETRSDRAVEAWLYEMSRGEYLQKRIHGDLADSVADFCDIELFVLGLVEKSRQADAAAKLRSLSTASGSRVLGVPRSVYVDKRINKEFCTKHASQVAFLSDSQLAQLGNAGAPKKKLKELLKNDQDGLLGGKISRKEYVETQFPPAARTHGLHKLSDMGVYALANKKTKDVKLFMEQLQDSEDRLNVQRSVLIRKIDPSLKDELCALDDVTLRDFAQKSVEEQKQWLQPKEGIAEEAKDESTREVGKHESAVAQIVAKEAKEGLANGSLSPSNGATIPADSKTEQPERTQDQKNEGKKQGKHKKAVEQIVAQTKEAEETVKNGASLPSAKEKEPPENKKLTEKGSKKEKEKPKKVKETASEKIEKEYEAATVKTLQSLVDRRCHLIALSVDGDLYRDSLISSIMVRENDASRKPVLISKARLQEKKVRRILKHLLESDEVLKVVHGCPKVSDALHHQFQISLNTVFDTAIAWQLLCDPDKASREPSVFQVLEKYGNSKGALQQANAKKEKPAGGAEKVLFDLMGMAGTASLSGAQTPDYKELELKGLLVASIAMSKLLKDQSKTFKRLCQEGLRKFRQWPGQHVQTLPLGEEVPFSYVDNKLVCHTSKDSKELQEVVETVSSQQLAEDASAAAELKLLFSFLSKPVLEAVESHWAEIGSQPMELVLSVGRQIEFRCRPFGEKRMRCDFLSHICSSDDLDAVVKKIGDKNFTVQDRAGIDGTLHRISAVRNKTGTVVTLVMRIGRSSQIVAGLVEDILADSGSVLILGPPGVGKTTLLRACAARMSEDRPTVIVDPAGEIAGCGDEPHKSVGRSLKDMAYSRSRLSRSEARREAMTRVVENMTPKVLVVDEIGTKGEAFAARTIGERGVQLVATAHGHNLFDLLANTELRDLVGGIVTSTLGDANNRVKESGRKNVSERAARPVFSTLVELKTPFSVAVHVDVAESVDAALFGRPIPVQVRSRDATGQMHVKLAKISSSNIS